jgi:hypothetical protein
MLPNKFIIVLLLSVVCVTLACKKEKEYAAYPYKSITDFSFTAETQQISAAITEDSIIIYWPSWENMPATIRPQISLSEHASISPASGESIDLKTGVAYTVKAEDGTTKTYHTKLVVNQPEIWINPDANISISEGGERAFEIEAYVFRHIIPDADKTKFFAVDHNGVEHSLNISFPATYPGFPGKLVVKVDLAGSTLPVGAYKLKITSGARTLLTEQKQMAVLYSGFPKADTKEGPVTVKRGETITFTGTGFVDMKDAIILTYKPDWSEAEIGKLEYVSHTATTAIYRVPMDFPPGTYSFEDYNSGKFIWINLRTSDFFSGWNYKNPKPLYVTVNSTGTFTVTE